MPESRCECGGLLERSKGPQIASLPTPVWRCNQCGRLFVVQMVPEPDLDLVPPGGMN